MYKRVLILLFLLILLGGAVYYYESRRSNSPDQASKQTESKPTVFVSMATVSTVSASSFDLQAGPFKATALLTPQTQIYKQVTGKDKKITLIAGTVSDIKKGSTVLVTPAPSQDGSFEVTKVQIIK